MIYVEYFSILIFAGYLCSIMAYLRHRFKKSIPLKEANQITNISEPLLCETITSHYKTTRFIWLFPIVCSTSKHHTSKGLGNDHIVAHEIFSLYPLLLICCKEINGSGSSIQKVQREYISSKCLLKMCFLLFVSPFP